MEIIKVLLIASLSSLIIGQTIRLPLNISAGAVTLTDILVLTLVSIFLVYAFFIKKSLLLPKEITFISVLFILSATASTILAMNIFSIAQIASSSLFLLRFIGYMSITIVVYNIVNKRQILKWTHLLLIIGLIFIFIGFIQLIFMPDFTHLSIYGWDPHQARIASTLLDPNFTGFCMVIFIALSISLYLYRKKNIYLLFSLFATVSLILTFSRSSYLAFIAVLLTVAIFKSGKILAWGFIILILAFWLIPQARQRTIGAFTIDKTAQARLESWENALKIFKDNYLFGVGFNTYRFAQARYGFFSFDNPQGGHSGAGSDSSILLVAATTGILGLSLFLFLLFSILRTSLKSIRSNFIALTTLASFLGLIIHSQFNNSIFFPQIMLIMWFLFGLKLKSDS